MITDMIWNRGYSLQPLYCEHDDEEALAKTTKKKTESPEWAEIEDNRLSEI